MDNETPEVGINNAESILAAGTLLAKPINLEPEKHDSALQVVMVPENTKVIPLEPLIAQFRAAPERIKACPRFETLDSLLEYVGDFKNDNTRVFVSAGQNKAPTVLAIIDHHESAGDARWCEHKALYVSQFSVEWNRWTSFDKRRLSQAEFATLLEENASLIIDPPGAELLELVTTLEGHADIVCNQLMRLPNGRVKLVYDENVSLTGQTNARPGEPMEFPSKLMVQIPPFDGGPEYKIPCRLRYRIENRKVTFWFECIDLHLVVKECVEAMVESIEEKLKLTPLMGSPS